MLRLVRILMKSIKWIFMVLATVLLMAAGYSVVLYCSADDMQPEDQVDLSAYVLSTDTDSLKVCGDNSLLLNGHGLWEARLTGTSLVRGVSFGVMARDLLHFQESAFVDQIKVLVPSDSYLRFLRAILKIFNRNMASYVPEEFRKEIYGISLSCSHEFDLFGTPYERQLNYHGAHDIGHMMQEYMLVGCSSFAAWEDMSEDNELIIGRNFDFWVGDDFARNRMLLFVTPDQGYKYASVSWPGMTGVVSGMNEKGLTVTINASKGAIPTSSALPISLLAKQILLYAENIDEAFEIASQHSLFVSESLLIGSAEDGRAAIIEKTPEKIGFYDPCGTSLLCTNHFQSDVYKDDEFNVRNIEESDSKYRFDRLRELVDAAAPVTPEKAAEVLRDRAGKGGKDVGLTNEMTLNQSIAHHSVIFQPQSLRMWVSTSPWQSGEMICYDLHEIFDAPGVCGKSLGSMELSIPADSAYINEIYPRVLKYREDVQQIRRAMKDGKELTEEFISQFISNNPEYFETYIYVGDYFEEAGQPDQAVKYWKMAATKEFPYIGVKNELETTKINKYDKR